VWLVVILLGVLALVALAAWSDRRDRRIGVDPSLRAQALGEQRRKVRSARADRTIARRLGRRGARPEPGSQPWER